VRLLDVDAHRWVDGAGHGLIDDAGPPLGDEIAAWLRPRV